MRSIHTDFRQLTRLALITMLIALMTVTETSFAQLNCPTAAFLDVQPDPANSAYPDPEVDVTCGTTSFTVTSNGIPNYEFVAITPGGLTAQNNSYTIPLAPSGIKADVPLLGDTGVLVNGIPIYGPNEGGNLGFGDPYLDNILDFCSGHVGPTGYHNHAPPICIFPDYQDNVGLVVGYSLDGWPILAPFECTDAACSSVVELQSSWQLTDASITAAWDKHSYVEGSGDLDECNGKAQPDGTYAYYATATFPYFMGCYVNADYDATVTATNTPVPAATTAPTSGSSVSVSANNMVLNVNDLTDITISAEDVPSAVHGFEVMLNYDATVLQFDSATPAAWVSSTGRTIACSAPVVSGGSVTMACATADDSCSGVMGPNGSGALATLSFTALAEGVSPAAVASVMLQGDSATGAIVVDNTADTSITVGTNIPTAITLDNLGQPAQSRSVAIVVLISMIALSVYALITRRNSLFMLLLLGCNGLFIALMLGFNQPAVQAQTSSDVAAVAAIYGCSTGDSCYDSMYDADSNGAIELSDMMTAANASCTATEVTNDVDTTLFFDGALAQEPVITNCTLSDGTATTCHEITITGYPANHDVGPFCPETTAATADDVGIWFDGNGLYDLDGSFILNLATLYNDNNWKLYDDNGNVNVTDTAEAFDAAARPDVDPAYQNHCVEGRIEWLDNGVPVESTVLIPTTPVVAANTTQSNGTLGVTLNGVIIDGEAPVDAILGAYTIAAFDDCGGHINPVAGYHLHGARGCSEVGTATADETPIFAYALDGYPIHSPLTDTAASAANLDECNGHTTEASGYHYHANPAEENSVLTCLKGMTVDATTTVPDDGGPGGDLPDFAAAAATLGITEAELMAALGGPPPDFTAAAATLGITEQELMDALEGN